jgi:hypothetical protein
MPEIVSEYLIQFEFYIRKKIKAIEELADIEDEYNKSLPSKELDKIKNSQ